MEYFFILIVPILFLRRCFRRDHQGSVKQHEKINFSIPSLVNCLLQLIIRIEFFIQGFRFLSSPVGGSLFIIAQKEEKRGQEEV